VSWAEEIHFLFSFTAESVGTGKLSLCLVMQLTMKVDGGYGGIAVDGEEWLPSCLGHFAPR
jgi:hypothetical protein